MTKKKKLNAVKYPKDKGLHDVSLEKDSCGTGFIVNIKQKETREITQHAIDMLIAMEHRGGYNADPETGDGVGITFAIPHSFFESALASQQIVLPPRHHYGVGNVYLPQDETQRKAYQQELQDIFKKEGLDVLTWRPLTVHSSKIGKESQACEPCIVQVFLVQQEGSSHSLEKNLYLARKKATHYFDVLNKNDLERCYICSLSSQIVVYKGMLTPHQLLLYYDDLQQDNFCTYLAMAHSRFATNTFPSWERSQPFRMMSHNGEINTIYGNKNKMHMREGVMKSASFKERLPELYPVIEELVSDSGAFDNTLEFLYHNGYSLVEAICMMIPEAWQHNTLIDKKRKSLYEVYSGMMDPWDGPACITFTDGRYIGVVVDRNGLRPSRYYITKDDCVIMASEFGVIELDPQDVIKKDRLQPGGIFLIDTHTHKIINDQEIKASLVSAYPFETWAKEKKISLADIKINSIIPRMDPEEVEMKSRSYGYSEEDKNFIIAPTISKGKEPLGSMGNDVALACLSDTPRIIYDYFKQWFAQVTNPPIDSIRERPIMSIGSYIGPEGNILDMAQGGPRLWLDTPLLSHHDFAKILHLSQKGWKVQTIDITYEISDGVEGLKNALNGVKAQVLQATEEETEIIILSDKAISSHRIALSTFMTMGAVHHFLLDKRARARTAIILETGEAREIHHYCALLGYGADAIYPYLVWEQASLLYEQKRLSPDITHDEIESQYKKAIDYGICKVLAKMGISTIDSYKGAQIFEAVGIGKEVIDECFTGTISRLGGIGYEEIFKETSLFHKHGFAPQGQNELQGSDIVSNGNFQWRAGGHFHLWNPESIALLQHAVRYDNRDTFEKYLAQQNQRSSNQATLRGLLRFKKGKTTPIAIEEVESADKIVPRFVTGAMSYGSISLVAHETLAIAMNRIGGKSNSGEGGEKVERYTRLENGDSKSSAIKQVASGRFGVTIEYLTNANEIQIKMAQGAKPGEGGELPKGKVFGSIAKTRHATEGVGLISPPPHHDIYSIEDLAQLIYDLKNANPTARISVKLVSKAGVGVIAAGVAKAKADHILISGHDGGTGAAHLTSIKHTGLPWELGIAETHQVLIRNNLRSRVTLQTDGQLKTGRDICIAAMLGAEEFCFATSALIAMGCIMMRKCEMNTCPVGIATHDEELVKKFTGSPEHVERLMYFLAEDTRIIMASLGYRTVDEMVGDVSMLEKDSQVLHWKSESLNLDKILGTDYADDELGQVCSLPQNHNLDSTLDQKMIKEVLPAITRSEVVSLSYPIKNTNRTTGTTISHEIAKRYGLKGLAEDTITLRFKGHAGQSFGAFLAHGLTLHLEGDANDYVGKGLSGGVIVAVPPKQRGFTVEDNIIVGNVVLYGAISGKAFFRGRVAERFCIRNSGALVVAEGAGVHACEYMTGGRVVILGSIGHNFASGMSGGIAYIWDKEGMAKKNINFSSVEDMDMNAYEEKELLDLITEYQERTESERAQYITTHWEEEKKCFIKITSPEYQKVLEVQYSRDKKGGVNG